MKLRYKVPIIILICFGVLLIALNRVFDALVLNDYQAVEQKFLDKDIERVKAVLEVTGNALVRNAEGFGLWDDTYNFMKGTNPKYKADTISYEGVGEFGIDHMIFIDKHGKIKDGITLNHDDKSFIQLDSFIIKEIESFPEFTKLLGTRESKTGILKLYENAYQYAVVPIQDNNATLAPIGNIIVTAKINKNFFENLGRQTKLNLRMLSINQSLKNEPVSGEILKKLLNQNKNINSYNLHQLDTNNTNQSISYSILNDFKGEPSVLIEIFGDREIYNQAISTKKTVIKTVSAIGFLTLCLIVLLLERYLLSRLRRLGDQIKTLAINQNTNDRVTMSGHDELAFLAKDVNKMLESLDNSRKELISAKEQSEKANQAKTRFLAAVSHELRTPIHGIFGLIRMCLKEETSPAKLSVLQMIQNTTQGLSETINDLLDISKNESGKLSFEKGRFEIREVVKDVLATISQRVNEKPDIELICTVNPSVPTSIKTDPLRIKQIMMNLLGNAVKFTSKGMIHLEVGIITNESTDEQPSNQNLVITCSDSGAGITKEKLASILNRNRQTGNKTEKSAINNLENNNKDKSNLLGSSGTGLGLIVVNEIIETLGGKFSVDSIVDEGSVFKVEIPVEVIDEKPLFIESERVVTCVTDNVHFINTLNIGLKPLKVTLVAAGKDSLSNYRGARLLVDGKLLEEETFWMKMKESIEFHNNKLIVILSPSQLMHKDRLNLLKVHSMLVKPFLPEDLIDLIKGRVKRELTSENIQNDIIATTKIKGLENLKVLIADDVKTNQIILANLVEEAGHIVKVVEDGQELVDTLATNSDFDIVLTDIQMPRLDGLAATKIIRDREKAKENSGESYKRMPIIAITAHAYPDEHQMMLDIGLDAVITKPIEPIKIKDIFKVIFRDRINGLTNNSVVESQNKNRIVSNKEKENISISTSKSFLNLNTDELDWGKDSREQFKNKVVSSKSTEVKKDKVDVASTSQNSTDKDIIEPVQTTQTTLSQDSVTVSKYISKTENIASTPAYNPNTTPTNSTVTTKKEESDVLSNDTFITQHDGPIIINNEKLFLDKDGLLKRAAGKPKVAITILDSFLESYPELTGELESASRGKDVKEIRRLAHALKGILLDIGCKSIATLALWLEKHPENADWNTISAVSDALVLKCDDLIVLVKKLKKELGGEGGIGVDSHAPARASDQLNKIID